MAYDELTRLLDKYFEGATSLAEEKKIRSLLAKTGDDPRFEADRRMFGLYDKSQIISKPPEGLALEIMEAVDKKRRVHHRRRFKQTLRWAGGIAATFILLIFAIQNTDNQQVASKDTFKNEEKAFKATKNVLKYVSGALNAEAGKLSGLSLINENLSHIQDLKKVDKAISKFKTEKK